MSRSLLTELTETFLHAHSTERQPGPKAALRGQGPGAPGGARVVSKQAPQCCYAKQETWKDDGQGEFEKRRGLRRMEAFGSRAEGPTLRELTRLDGQEVLRTARIPSHLTKFRMSHDIL